MVLKMVKWQPPKEEVIKTSLDNKNVPEMLLEKHQRVALFYYNWFSEQKKISGKFENSEKNYSFLYFIVQRQVSCFVFSRVNKSNR